MGSPEDRIKHPWAEVIPRSCDACRLYPICRINAGEVPIALKRGVGKILPDRRGSSDCTANFDPDGVIENAIRRTNEK